MVASASAFFRFTLNKTVITTKTVILGDFNFDLNKEQCEYYYKKNYLHAMLNILGHHNLDQIVKEDTWSRVINNVYTSSRLDHIYTTETNRIQNLEHCDMV